MATALSSDNNQPTMKDIIGYESLYSVTDDGRVWRKAGSPKCSVGRWLKMTRTNNGQGYYCVILSSDGKLLNHRVHRLVAAHFIKNPGEKPCVNHKDGNKLNNNVSNLEWVTHSENTLHALRKGLFAIRKGERVTQSRLTESAVRTLRQRHIDTHISYVQLAKEYDLTPSSIRNAIIGETWRHVI